MRKTGMSRSGPVMVTRATRASTRALRWLGVPVAMTWSRWSVPSHRQASSAVEPGELSRRRRDDLADAALRAAREQRQDAFAHPRPADIGGDPVRVLGGCELESAQSLYGDLVEEDVP